MVCAWVGLLSPCGIPSAGGPRRHGHTGRFRAFYRLETAEGGRSVRRAVLALLVTLLALIPAVAGSGRIARADNEPTTPAPPPGIVSTPIGPPVKGGPMLSSQ